MICSPRDRVDVQLHFRFAVLERVLGALGFVRQSPFFPERNKADAEFVRDDRSEKKSARIDPNDLVDLFAAATFEKNIDRRAEQRAILQNRGVMSLKTIPFFGKSGTSRTAVRNLSIKSEVIGSPMLAGRP